MAFPCEGFNARCLTMQCIVLLSAVLSAGRFEMPHQAAQALLIFPHAWHDFSYFIWVLYCVVQVRGLGADYCRVLRGCFRVPLTAFLIQPARYSLLVPPPCTAS